MTAPVRNTYPERELNPEDQDIVARYSRDRRETNMIDKNIQLKFS